MLPTTMNTGGLRRFTPYTNSADQNITIETCANITRKRPPPDGSGLPDCRSFSVRLAEQRQDVLAVAVSQRQRLDAQLLLNLQSLHAG